MTDLEMTRLCAEAMGYTVKDSLGDMVRASFDHRSFSYHPLHDDAQAMALDGVLLAHGWYSMHSRAFNFYDNRGQAYFFEMEADMTKAENRRRARVSCVAKLKGAKP